MSATKPIAIIPKIEAIILFLVFSFNFDQWFIITNAAITTINPINAYFGIKLFYIICLTLKMRYYITIDN